MTGQKKKLKLKLKKVRKKQNPSPSLSEKAHAHTADLQMEKARRHARIATADAAALEQQTFLKVDTTCAGLVTIQTCYTVKRFRRYCISIIMHVFITCYGCEPSL